MERHAQERLIGASILVVLAVLVVPELLSGPKPVAPPTAPMLPAPSANAPEPTRTVTVDLATSKPTSADTEGGPDSAVSASAPAAAGAPTSGSVPPAPAAAAAETGLAPSAPVTGAVNESKPLKSVSPAAPRTVDSPAVAPTYSREWAVQLGSFANRGNAENLVHRLKSQGFQVYDSASGAGQAQRFRVRIGPLPDRAAADRTIAKLKALGHAASVVPPAR